MNEHLISLFIDDELELDEKIEFVQTVHGDVAYKTDAVEMLHQEKRLRHPPVSEVPPVIYPQARRPWRPNWLRPMVYSMGCLLLGFMLWYTLVPTGGPDKHPLFKHYRFVIYQPHTHRVEISGSFTGWQSKDMRRIGDTGYWEAEFNLPGGEQRFAYILDGNRRITDPTIQTREKDDFGGENSILSVSL
jgi:hypothetical protein